MLDVEEHHGVSIDLDPRREHIDGDQDAKYDHTSRRKTSGHIRGHDELTLTVTAQGRRGAGVVQDWQATTHDRSLYCGPPDTTSALAPSGVPSGGFPGRFLSRSESTNAVTCKTPAPPSGGPHAGIPLAAKPSR